MTNTYSIGTPGQKWGQDEKLQWFKNQSIQRSYQNEVVDKLNDLPAGLILHQYGALPYDESRYPLLMVKSKDWSDKKGTILVTGGVHGYETSGVQGAICFAKTEAAKYLEKFNLLIAVCVSPWGYETINRWNPNAVDPNRSFYDNSPSAESAALMNAVSELANGQLLAHIDLHETTDTDNSEFRPALAARDAVEHKNWNIPDGFYLVGDTENPKPAFQKAVIESVKKITHIAPADENGCLIGEPMEQFGVINYATKALGLCTGFSDAKYNTTTEVYPDSPLVDDENCNLAQVAAITGALEHIMHVEA